MNNDDYIECDFIGNYEKIYIKKKKNKFIFYNIFIIYLIILELIF